MTPTAPRLRPRGRALTLGAGLAAAFLVAAPAAQASCDFPDPDLLVSADASAPRLAAAVSWLKPRLLDRIAEDAVDQYADDDTLAGIEALGTDPEVRAAAQALLGDLEVVDATVLQGASGPVVGDADYRAAAFGQLPAVVLAQKAAGLDPSAIGDRDLRAELLADYDEGAGRLIDPQSGEPTLLTFQVARTVSALAATGPLPRGLVLQLQGFLGEDGRFKSPQRDTFNQYEGVRAMTDARRAGARGLADDIELSGETLAGFVNEVGAVPLRYNRAAIGTVPTALSAVALAGAGRLADARFRNAWLTRAQLTSEDAFADADAGAVLPSTDRVECGREGALQGDDITEARVTTAYAISAWTAAPYAPTPTSTPTPTPGPSPTATPTPAASATPTPTPGPTPAASTPPTPASPAPTVSAPAPAPAPKVSLSLDARTGAVKKGATKVGRSRTLTASCALPAAGRCAVLASVSRSRAKALGLKLPAKVDRLVVGRGAVSAAAGGKRTVEVELTKAFARALARTSSPSTPVRLTATWSAGPQTASTEQQIRLR